jgi:hypothetical protein
MTAFWNHDRVERRSVSIAEFPLKVLNRDFFEDRLDAFSGGY